jgi:hypothetical protein
MIDCPGGGLDDLCAYAQGLDPFEDGCGLCTLGLPPDLIGPERSEGPFGSTPRTAPPKNAGSAHAANTPARCDIFGSEGALSGVDLRSMASSESEGYDGRRTVPA